MIGIFSPIKFDSKPKETSKSENQWKCAISSFHYVHEIYGNFPGTIPSTDPWYWCSVSSFLFTSLSFWHPCRWNLLLQHSWSTEVMEEGNMMAVKVSKVPKAALKGVCQVCDDEATGHSYYRGLCCFSCRVFFRRCVLRPEINVCQGHKNCIVDLATRSNCQYCRFQKCLSIGMDPATVKPPRQERISVKSILNNR